MANGENYLIYGRRRYWAFQNIINEFINSNDIIDNLLFEMFAMRVKSNGKYKLRPMESVYTGEVWTNPLKISGVEQVSASLSSLDVPANMMPDRVPVKNVAIGTINSKNFWSIGEIAFSGCVTKIKEYNTTNTIPNSVNVKQIPIKNFRRAISCSSVYITLSVLFSFELNKFIYKLLLLVVLSNH
jgi:hypothetical protein